MTKEQLLTYLSGYGSIVSDELIETFSNVNKYVVTTNVSGVVTSPPKRDWWIEETIYEIDGQAYIAGPTKTPIFAAVNNAAAVVALQTYEKVYPQEVVMHASRYASFRVYDEQTGQFSEPYHLFLNADDTGSLYDLATPDEGPPPARAPWCMDYIMFSRTTPITINPTASPAAIAVPLGDTVGRNNSPDGYIALDAANYEIDVITQQAAWNDSITLPCKYDISWNIAVSKNISNGEFTMQLYDGGTPVGDLVQVKQETSFVRKTGIFPVTAGETHAFSLRISQTSSPPGSIDIHACFGKVEFLPW